MLLDDKKIRTNLKIDVSNKDIVEKTNISIHLLELKYRIIYLIISFILAFIVSCNYFTEYLYLLSYFILEHDNNFVYSSLTEPIFVFLKVTLFFSLLFTFPYFLYTINSYLSKTKYNTYVTFINIMLLVYGILLLDFGIIVGWCIYPTLYAFILEFQKPDHLYTMNTLVFTNVNLYVNFLMKNFVFIIFLMSLPSVFKFLKEQNWLPWGEEVKYAEQKWRKKMYFLTIVCIMALSPPDFMYHFFVLPISIIFLEIYVLILMISDVIMFLIRKWK